MCIAKCYIFFLPFRMITILTGVFSIFGALAYYFDFVFLLLGALSYLINYRGIIPYREKTMAGNVLWSFVEALIIFMFFSAIMSMYVSIYYNTYGVREIYSASFKMIINFIFYLAMIAYGRHIFSVLAINSVYSVLHKSILFLIIIGYVQFFNKIGVNLNGLYSILQRTINLSKLSSDICLTTMEPSHAAMVIGTIVLPYYLSFLLSNCQISLGQVIEFALWIPLILISGSSTMYIICGIEIVFAVVWLIFKQNVSFCIKILSILIGGILIIVLNNPGIIDKLFNMNFSYLLLEKLTDLGNQSTASRSLALIVNFYIFLRFPIIGCGNGLQGCFYSDYSYLMSGMVLDESVVQLLSGTLDGIANGCTFFSGILSGWGIIGVLLFLRFLLKSVYCVRNKKDKMGLLYYFYILAFIGVLISGIKSEFVGLPYIWFIFAIPTVDFTDNINAI